VSSFRLNKTCPRSQARAGELLTRHGKVPTPVFLPVGSQGAVKTLTPEEVKALGMNMVLANTYHLYLRPGISVIKKAGGLHKFNRLSPELVIRYQEALGADIIMALDECPAHDDSPEKVKRATERTHKWAERCRKAQKRRDQALYAIVQGGVIPELRRQSAEYLASLDFPGYAIGGLSIGEPKEVTLAMVEETVAFLPEGKPRYLMGVGSPEDIVEAVARGCDIFDSALPTRVARNGALFTWQGRRNISNAAYSRMQQAIVADCDCYTCRNFSAAYLHHLFNCGELLAYRLATIHNLSFISQLMAKIKSAILDGTFPSFKDKFLAGYRSTDERVRLSQKRKWLERRNLGS